MTQKRRTNVGTLRMCAAIHVNHPPGMRTRDVQDEDALEIGYVDNLKPWRVEKCRARRGFAIHEWRVNRVGGSAVFVDGCGPRLKRHVRGARKTTEAGTNFPISLLAGDRTQIRMTVGPPRSRLRGRRIGWFRGRGFALLALFALSETGRRQRQHDRQHCRDSHDAYLVGSFCPLSRTSWVVCIAPTQAFLASLATAAPSIVILSPILTVSRFQPPRVSA